MSRPLKRSFTLDGHRTSISLEAPFWEALQEVAAGQGLSVAALVQDIDHRRGKREAGAAAGGERRDSAADSGLSGAIRVHLLRHYRMLAART